LDFVLILVGVKTVVITIKLKSDSKLFDLLNIKKDTLQNITG